MKLLELFSSPVRGGAEEYTLTVATAAVQKGWQVHAAFPKTDGTLSLIEDFQANHVNYHPLAIRDGDAVRFQLARHQFPQFHNTLRLLLTIKPDVVLINLPWPDRCFGIILACGLLRIPTAIVLHLIPYQFFPGQQRLNTYAWARARNQQWLTISKFNRDLISKSFQIPQEEIRCIYNGTKLERSATTWDSLDSVQLRKQVRHELGIPETSKIAITVGRLEAQKGHRDLVAAIPHLVKEFPDLKFVWVGEGQERAALSQQLQEYNVADQVLLLGYRSDVSRLLQASDLFIFPTHFEGQPFALLEAMAHRLPIVTSKASGIPEVIAHGLHGLLFRTQDTCDLLETVRWALRNPAPMQDMADNAQLRVQEFSEEKMLGETLDLLETLSRKPS